MTINASEITPGHHLIISRNASIALFLIFKVLLAKQFKQVRVTRCLLLLLDLLLFMDANDFLRTRFETFIVELLFLNAFPLSFIDMLGGRLAFILELHSLTLHRLDLLDLLLDSSLLLRVETTHVNLWILAGNPLWSLDPTLLVQLTLRLIKNIIYLILDGLIDLALAREVRS